LKVLAFKNEEDIIAGGYDGKPVLLKYGKEKLEFIKDITTGLSVTKGMRLSKVGSLVGNFEKMN